MSYFILLLCFCSLGIVSSVVESACCATSAPVVQSPPDMEKYPQKILLKENFPDGKVELSTPLAVYENNEGKAVYLVGAVHIGEKKYYEELNKRFASYDVLLFEMIGGEGVQKSLELKEKQKEGSITKEESKELAELMKSMEKQRAKESGLLKLLAGQYGKVASMLGITSQKEGIDYSPSNFVHADMTLDEMNAAQKAKGESIVGLMVSGIVKSFVSPKPSSSTPDLMTLFSAIKREDKGTLKKIFIDMLAPQAKGSFLENSVLMDGRNDKCLHVFDKVVSENPELKKIGIFYGAAHLTDLHKKLEKKGYRFRSVEWIPAWTVDPKSPSSKEDASDNR